MRALGQQHCCWAWRGMPHRSPGDGVLKWTSVLNAKQSVTMLRYSMELWLWQVSMCLSIDLSILSISLIVHLSTYTTWVQIQGIILVVSIEFCKPCEPYTQEPPQQSFNIHHHPFSIIETCIRCRRTINQNQH